MTVVFGAMAKAGSAAADLSVITQLTDGYKLIMQAMVKMMFQLLGQLLQALTAVTTVMKLHSILKFLREQNSFMKH